MSHRIIVPPVPFLVRVVASRWIIWTSRQLVRFAVWITPEINQR